MSSDYTDYHQWKHWSSKDFFKVIPDEVNYLSKDIEAQNLGGSKILEIGFGNASKLAWFRSLGAEVYGVEVNSHLQNSAMQAGIQTLPPDFAFISAGYKDFFDIVIAYDVLEHLKLDEVISFMNMAETVLKGGGLCVVRFPNGRSPFGRYHQHADYTHQSTLSDSIVEQVIQGSPLYIEHVSDGLSFDYKLVPSGLLKLGKHAARKFFLKAMSMLLDLRGPLGPNLIIRLRKRPMSSQ